jgi:hypothetical protein
MMGTPAPRPSYYRMTIAEFRRAAFLGRAPCANTIKTIIERGDWAGEKVGGLYFVFVDEAGQPLRGRVGAPRGTGNADADRLIIQWEQGQ